MERYRGIEDVPSTRARRMHRYWLDKKGERAMPARSDIEPGEIKDLLPHVILSRLEYEPFRVLYKLIGTRAAENAGMDYSGHYLDELDFVSEYGTDWPAVYRAIAADKAPIYGLCQIRFTDGVIKPYVVRDVPAVQRRRARRPGAGDRGPGARPDGGRTPAGVGDRGQEGLAHHAGTPAIWDAATAGSRDRAPP